MIWGSQSRALATEGRERDGCVLKIPAKERTGVEHGLLRQAAGSSMSQVGDT